MRDKPPTIQKILAGGFMTLLLGVGAILIDSARTQNTRIVALHGEITARMDSMQISINGRIDKLYERQTNASCTHHQVSAGI